MPSNQKINFTFNFDKGNYQYSGTFSGEGAFIAKEIVRGAGETLQLGDSLSLATNYNLYHFSASYTKSDGYEISCDMYPCVRESDGVAGMYDIENDVFFAVVGNDKPNFQVEAVVVPVLSSNSKGINSMKADVSSKATNVTSTNNA